MGISAGELDVNTRHINELATQIRSNNDCEVMRLIVEEHLGSITDLFADIQREQQELIDKILPLLGLPSANPIAIVAYLTKLATGLITPQLKAHIKYTKRVIKLAVAILNLVVAIEQAAKRLPECALLIEDQLLAEVRLGIDSLVNTALAEVQAIQNSLLPLIDVANTIERIDVSSPEAFLNSVDRSFQAIEGAVKLLNEQPLPTEPPTE